MLTASTKRINILFIGLLILGFVLPQPSLAIGQITKPIVIEDILRGQEITTTLSLFNSENQETIYGLKAEGEIADWATFYRIEDSDFKNPITEISIPAQSYIEAIVKFTVPEDTPNGGYSGKVYVFSLPAKDQEADKMVVTVAQRIGRKVSITVTDEEIVEFNTTIIPLKYGVGKDEPLKIKVIYDNKGNVLIKPDLQLSITKAGQTIFNAIFPYPETEKAVRPLERKVFPCLIEWQTTGQKEGRYMAEIKVLLNNEIIEEKSFSFIIDFNVERFLAFIASIGGGNLAIGWFAIGGFFLAVAAILTFFALFNRESNKKKKNNKKKSKKSNKKTHLLLAGIEKFKSLF